VLRHLTDTDLEKIGISLGHRRKLLAAMRRGTGCFDRDQCPKDG
jgi:hypothetical protein